MAEAKEVAEQPAPAPTPPAAKTPAQELIDDYHLDDEPAESTSSVPVDSTPAPPEASAAGPLPPGERQRDPATGRFLPKEAAVTPTPAAATPEPPAAPKHPKALEQMAKDFGVSQEQIDRATTDALADHVHGLQRYAWQLAQQNAQQQTIQQQSEHPPGSQPAPAKTPAADDLTISEDEFDPKLAKSVNSQASEIKQLKGMVEALLKREQQREARRGETQIDRAFAGLGAEYHGVFGDGPVTTLGRDGPEVRRRVAVIELIKRMGNQPGTFEDKLKTVAKDLFGGMASAPAPKPQPEPGPKGSNGTAPRITEQQWNEAALAKPTARQAPEVKGTKAAEKSVAEWLHANQYTEESDPGENAFLE